MANLVFTQGFTFLAEDIKARVLGKFMAERAKSDDDMIVIEHDGKKYYACKNELGGFTLMLPEEY